MTRAWYGTRFAGVAEPGPNRSTEADAFAAPRGGGHGDPNPLLTKTVAPGSACAGVTIIVAPLWASADPATAAAEPAARAAATTKPALRTARMVPPSSIYGRAGIWNARMARPITNNPPRP